MISLLLLSGTLPLQAAPPAVGDNAPDFTLSTPDGRKIHLSAVAGKGTVALVLLRGFPGYTCPYCNTQVRDLTSHMQELADAHVHLIIVYPGPPKDPNAPAAEFLTGTKLTENFDLVLDPAYQMTNLYGLRWDAPSETAHPATFLIDSHGVVFFAKISKGHAERATSAEIVDAMKKTAPVK